MTPELLKAMVPGATWDRCLALAPHLAETFARFGIEGPDAVAAFIGQAAHETASFRYLREIASGAAYEGRKDLGNIQPGDGTRYPGRGVFQTTGRANYARVGAALEIDAIGHPELLEEPRYAALSAGLYWSDNRLARYATSSAADYDRLGAAINTGNPDWIDRMNGREDRRRAWDRAVLVLKSPETYTALIAAQASLQRMGHYTGAIDGIGGPKTTAALRAFQTAAGLHPSGALDADTIAALALPAGYKTGPGGNVTRDDVKDSRIVKEAGAGGMVAGAGAVVAGAGPVAQAAFGADWKVVAVIGAVAVILSVVALVYFRRVRGTRIAMNAAGIA